MIVPEAELEEMIGAAPAVVFEGAQGVLLDETHGFHPHTTWSNCTFDNALDDARAFDVVQRVGVLRALPSRHGAGPFPTEDAAVTPAVRELHNLANAWQGTVRHGWFDVVLARYALEVTGGIDVLALTHLDAVERLGRFRVAEAYEVASLPRLAATVGGEPSDALTRWLGAAKPIYREADEDRVPREIEALLGVRVGIVSRGPSADRCRDAEMSSLTHRSGLSRSASDRLSAVLGRARRPAARPSRDRRSRAAARPVSCHRNRGRGDRAERRPDRRRPRFGVVALRSRDIGPGS